MNSLLQSYLTWWYDFRKKKWLGITSYKTCQTATHSSLNEVIITFLMPFNICDVCILIFYIFVFIFSQQVCICCKY